MASQKLKIRAIAVLQIFLDALKGDCTGILECFMWEM